MLASGLSRILISLSRDSWPDTGGDLIMFGVEYSTDGLAWRLLVGGTAPGGTLVRGTGETIAASRVSVDLPDVGQTGRQVRAYIENTAALTTAITVEVF